VIEAMKMDNILRAGRDGIVETIHTAEGHQVAHGELLLEYRR
jgi:biotin carboxyl carrier protein